MLSWGRRHTDWTTEFPHFIWTEPPTLQRKSEQKTCWTHKTFSDEKKSKKQTATSAPSAGIPRKVTRRRHTIDTSFSKSIPCHTTAVFTPTRKASYAYHLLLLHLQPSSPSSSKVTTSHNVTPFVLHFLPFLRFPLLPLPQRYPPLPLPQSFLFYSLSCVFLSLVNFHPPFKTNLFLLPFLMLPDSLV